MAAAKRLDMPAASAISGRRGPRPDHPLARRGWRNSGGCVSVRIIVMPTTPSSSLVREGHAAPVHPNIIPAEFVPERRGAVVVLSSSRRDGDWILPRLFRVVACLGNMELDLTSAKLAPGESHIEIRCFFGNVEITVPPEIRVEAEGHPFIGVFESRAAPVVHSPDAPLLRITGSVFAGAVTIKVVDPKTHVAAKG